MLSAGVLAVLIFVDKWTSLSVPFPGFWYTTRSFHVVFCAGMVVLGWFSHRHASGTSRGKGATSAVFESVVLYGQSDCGLCDRAMDVLSEYSSSLPEVRKVDISGDTELEELYASCIPVVEIDGRIRFRGIVSAELLERMIEAQQLKQSV